jgi:UDP-N-acetylmuramoylalanine--D-glutamate ligase
MDITKQFENKKVMIWGYGREGRSAEAFLKEHCKPESITIWEGSPAELRAEDYDYIIKSPGIAYFSEDEKFTSATEIFMSAFRENTVGITGTKGKSTTTALLAHVLRECTGRPVILMGNIGLPCLDYYGEMTPDTIAVFELSCHQLANARTAPHISIFLNLFEEHLDYYGTLDRYFTAKAHITTRQLPGDFFYCGENVPEIETAATKEVVRATEVRECPGLQLFGKHNQLNAEFVRRIAEDRFGCDPDAVNRALASFESLPHRMQKLGEHAGLYWYDDSISTIPEATIQAATSIPGVETLLVGGMDRGIHYGILVDFMKAHPELQFICMYATGARIAKEAGNLPNISVVEELKQAVELARKITPPGKGVALSPAAASYGYFKNFEERGDVFADLVRKLV